MPNTPPGMRQCPTRADGATALFAHVIDGATCQARQRQHYHKCPTCTHYNARSFAAAPARPLNGVALGRPSTNGRARNGALAPLPPPAARVDRAASPATSEAPAR